MLGGCTGVDSQDRFISSPEHGGRIRDDILRSAACCKKRVLIMTHTINS